MKLIEIKENTYEVDGILFQRDHENLIMKFRVGGAEHRFRIKMANALKMAEVLQKLFLEKN